MLFAFVTATLVGLMTAVLACSGSDVARGKGETHVKEPVALEWKLTPGVGGKSVRITYSIANASKERIYVLDQMVVEKGETFHLAPEAAIVLGGDAGTVRFIRGYTPPGARVTLEFIPGARALDPGRTLSGSAEVPLPIQAWHPNTGYQSLDTPPAFAVLEIGYVTGEPEWTHPPLSDGMKLAAPKFSYVYQHQKFVVGAAHPIP